MDKKPKNIMATISRLWSNYSYIFVLLLILIVYAIVITNNGQTFGSGHISTILSSQYTVIVGTIALGMALVIITGQIDLSVGSTLVITTASAIMAYNLTGGSAIMMVLAGIFSGFLCGLINGVLVGYAQMPPFIVTLGTMLVYRSLALSFVNAKLGDFVTKAGITSGQFKMLSTFDSYDLIRMQFGSGALKILGFKIPYITILFVLITILFIVITQKTKYGKSVYAVGSNEKAARLTGINVTNVKMSVFIITGVLVGIAGIMQACKMSNVNPASSGTSYEMYAIASVVLGGVAMSGGRGKILGVLFGAMSYCTVNTIIAISGLPITMQDAFQGVVLITVILIQAVSPIIKEKLDHAKKRKANAL
ncbi:MAG: ABC transporter permease [Bacillota bacterium]|nr:ABC transporter permease [Bacillota bacterium]